MGFVFPQLTPIFKEANIDLPFLLRYFYFWEILSRSGGWFLIFLIMITISLINYFKSPEGKVVFDEVAVKLPVLEIYLSKHI